MLQLLRKLSPRAVNAYSTSHSTLHEEELDKFRVMASSWWDINGPFKALHSFNKLRFSTYSLLKLQQQPEKSLYFSESLLSEMEFLRIRSNLTTVHLLLHPYQALKSWMLGVEGDCSVKVWLD